MKDAILIKLHLLKIDIGYLVTRNTYDPRIKRETLEAIDNLINELK